MINRITALLLFIGLTWGQDVKINEVMSSNQITIYDENGDTPDWIELYNSSLNSISLHNWGLTDRHEEPFKWQFPDLDLQSSEFLLVMASEKNRKDIIRQWHTIIDWGDEFHYFPGTEEPPSNWTQPGFDISDWSSGVSGFGYGDGDDNTILDTVNSVYISKSFFVEIPEHVIWMALNIDYDDAFVAYLNGVEFARKNIGVQSLPPVFDQGANICREAEMYNGGEPSLFWVDSTITWLVPGENILAIQIHNYNGLGPELVTSISNSISNPWEIFTGANGNTVTSLINDVESGEAVTNEVGANPNYVYKIVCTLTINSGSPILNAARYQGSYTIGDFQTGNTHPALISGTNIYYVNFSSVNRDYLWINGDSDE